jgi:Ca-activated chloride channel family protein
VSFGAPLVLLALLALPLLGLVYLREQRRRTRAASAFTSAALRPSVAPRRSPGWRRHAPFAVLALALAALIAAAARPERTVAVPIERASIMLLSDTSGSMRATDVKPDRLSAAKLAAHRFTATVPARLNVGLLAFNQTARVLQSPTRDRTAVSIAIDSMSARGSTAVGEAIATAARVLGQTPGELGRRPPAAMVLLSDGGSTRGRSPIAAAQAARRLKIPIYTVALGTPSGTYTVPRRGGGTQVKQSPPDPRALAEIAHASGGSAFTAQTASGLRQVYEKLGSQLGHRDQKRQVTSVVAGGGLVLLLAATGMSLAWFGRLI